MPEPGTVEQHGDTFDDTAPVSPRGAKGQHQYNSPVCHKVPLPDAKERCSFELKRYQMCSSTLPVITGIAGDAMETYPWRSTEHHCSLLALHPSSLLRDRAGVHSASLIQTIATAVDWEITILLRAKAARLQFAAQAQQAGGVSRTHAVQVSQTMRIANRCLKSNFAALTKDAFASVLSGHTCRLVVHAGPHLSRLANFWLLSCCMRPFWRSGDKQDNKVLLTTCGWHGSIILMPPSSHCRQRKSDRK